MQGLRVDDYYELLALHRALMEAKFGHTPRDPVIRGSALVARICDRLIEVLAETEEQRGVPDAKLKWEAWRSLEPKRVEWAAIVEAAANTPAWEGWSEQQRIEYIALVAAPFKLSDEMVFHALQDIQALRVSKG